MMVDSYILCLETSGPQCSVALSHNGTCIAEQVTEDAWHHSQYLTTHIQKCLSQADVSIKDLSAIAVSHGPGSYTGLRVGASTSKGICYALDIPLISIDTLKIIAHPWTSDIGSAIKILSTIDARRDEIYYNIYDNALSELTETQSHVLNPESFEEYAKSGLIVAGDGADKTKVMHDGGYSEAFTYHQSYPTAKHMTQLAFDKYKADLLEDIAYYNPFYMKPPNITTRKKPLF